MAPVQVRRTMPSRSITNEVGRLLARKAVVALYCGSGQTGKVRRCSSTKARTSSIGCPSSIATMTKPDSLWASKKACKAGISSLQGGHQVAQALYKMTCPRKSERATGFPFRSVSCTSGAGKLTGAGMAESPAASICSCAIGSANMAARATNTKPVPMTSRIMVCWFCDLRCAGMFISLCCASIRPAFAVQEQRQRRARRRR